MNPLPPTSQSISTSSSRVRTSLCVQIPQESRRVRIQGWHSCPMDIHDVAPQLPCSFIGPRLRPRLPGASPWEGRQAVLTRSPCPAAVPPAPVNPSAPPAHAGCVRLPSQTREMSQFRKPAKWSFPPGGGMSNGRAARTPAACRHSLRLSLRRIAYN